MSLRLRSTVLTTETDYGTVLFDERNGDYYQLNPSGALVVRTLLDGGNADDAVHTLVTEFNVDTARAQHDVTALLQQLRSSRLVTS